MTLLTITEVSRRWAMSPDFIRARIARGELGAVRLGRSLRIPEGEADAFVARRIIAVREGTRRGDLAARGGPADPGAPHGGRPPVRDIRRLRDARVPGRIIAARYGIHIQWAYLIGRRLVWRHLPDEADT